MASWPNEQISNHESEALASSYKADESPPPDHIKPRVTTSLSADADTKTMKVTRVWSSKALGRFASSGCIAALPLYFITFAVLAHKQNGMPSADRLSQALLEAAKAGPTVFAILFTAIVGRFLKSLAAASLERGATVGFVEYLMASRTVSAAATTPLRLRYAHPVIPFLLTLWALSPLGGQAALRIVSQETELDPQNAMFNYLDLNSSMFLLQGEDTASQYGSGVSAAFNAALISSASSKRSGRDTFGNVKIPMIESLAMTRAAGEDGWYQLSGDQETIYTALLGLPVLGVPSDANSTFDVQTTYMYPSCSLVGHSYPTGLNFSSGLANSSTWFSNGFGFILGIDRAHDYMTPWPTNISLISSGIAGQTGDHDIVVTSNASCEILQTYVELKVACVSTVCTASSIRESQLAHLPRTATALDGIFASPTDYTITPASAPLMSSTGWFFLMGMINVTQPNGYLIRGDESTAFEYYFVNPDAPFATGQGLLHDITLYQIGDALFSERFAQLINTFWLSGVAPNAMTGNFTSPSNAYYGVALGNGIISHTSIVLRCHNHWLVILLVTSMTMLCVGLAAAALDFCRRGPDVLDGFATILRDNPYAQLRSGSSMEDQMHTARRLKGMKVRLGDVQPTEEVGHVAIGMPTQQQPVKRLQSGRWYD